MSERFPRRRFLGYLVAAPTVLAAAPLGFELFHQSAEAALPSLSLSDIADLTDLLTDATLPTAFLISVAVNKDGTASFALPRAEVGQGITTAVAMVIAEELDLAVSKVDVTLSDARPELLWNQLTGGSNSMHSLWTPVRVAAALARQQLLQAAVTLVGGLISDFSTADGVVYGPNRWSKPYGELTSAGAVTTTTPAEVQLKAAADFAVVGTPQGRVDALDAVTGRKRFTMDMEVPNALPTMVCRPPTINGTPIAVANISDVLAMPGVTDVAVIPTGVAVRAKTFGQCIDAVDALRVTWAPGPNAGKSDASVLAELAKAELPLLPTLPLLAKTVEQKFTFAFVSNSPLETGCAIADVRPGSAEVWSPMKSPIVAQQTIAKRLGLPQNAVTCHVTEGGGSFGRHLFFDAPLEAAIISQKMGKPVKLMWHRTDDFRQGRVHPMATCHVRASYLGTDVLTFEQRHTGVSTDYSHGLGEILSAEVSSIPDGNFLAYSQGVFYLTQNVPYDFGVTDQMLNEVDMGFNTGSWRNIYSPDVVTAMELVVDQLANAMHQDPLQFRRNFLRDDRLLACLNKVADVGKWGRSDLPAGWGQGLGVHGEYKSKAAALVEIDCTPATVNRVISNAYTGPRVTKVVVAVDAGLAINPLGLQAQMMGGAMDAIAKALTFSLHIKDGIPVEGSWDQTFYTRQWNAPFDVEVIVMPPTTGVPGGAGELAVAPVMAAVACAYARATRTMPTVFPINHNVQLTFTELPTVPPLPEEPTDGLSMAF